MKRFSLSVGINDYPGSGSDLSGCVNDADNWHRLLSGLDPELKGLHVELTNDSATKATVVDILRSYVAQAKFGDRIYFSYSGHGSWVPDQNGDEIDGRDEVLCLYDYPTGGLLKDDEINEIFSKKRFGVRIYFFSDSCHSGSVARLIDIPQVENDWRPADRQVRVPKFIPPASFLTGGELLAANAAKDMRVTEASRNNGVLISGCGDTEYSYDAYINGVPQGAFSWAAHLTYYQGVSMKAWHKMILAALSKFPEYNQHPELSGSIWQKSWSL